MKKLLLAFTLILSFAAPALAQGPTALILELRDLLKKAPTGFVSYKGEVLQQDDARTSTIYKSKRTPKVPIAEHFVVEKPGIGLAFYMVRYNTAEMEPNMLSLFPILVQKYVEEMNAMVKSGKYTGSDHKEDDGTSVTEILDLKGRKILDYRSDDDNQLLLIYTTKRN